MLDLGCVEVKLVDPESGAGVDALRGVSLRVREGEAVALIGPSGAGKSTLLAVAAGLVRVASGAVIVAGREVSRRSRSLERWLRATVGVAFQFPERAFFAATVREEVAFTPSQLGWNPRSIGKAVERALSLVGMDDRFATRSPFRLSGGEKRRVALAAAIAHRPKLVLFDEPEAGLDVQGRERIDYLIDALKREGAAVVVATHDAGWAVRWADRCVLLEAGRIAAVVDTAEGVPADGLHLLAPYLWDDGILARLFAEGKRRGIELPDPYKRPDAFFAALRKAPARWPGRHEAKPAP